jgi:hypothetical protein
MRDGERIREYYISVLSLLSGLVSRCDLDSIRIESLDRLVGVYEEVVLRHIVSFLFLLQFGV